MAGLAWAGIELDPAANLRVAGADALISAPGARVAVLVCPVDEESLICRDVAAAAV